MNINRTNLQQTIDKDDDDDDDDDHIGKDSNVKYDTFSYTDMTAYWF
jgi:hypothetical protein